MGCGRSLEKRTLLRLARGPEGELLVDSQGRVEGRGAYVCAQPECAASLARSGTLARALRAPVTVTPKTIELIGEWQESASTK